MFLDVQRSKEKEEESRNLREALAASVVRESIARAESLIKEDIINQLKAK